MRRALFLASIATTSLIAGPAAASGPAPEPVEPVTLHALQVSGQSGSGATARNSTPTGGPVTPAPSPGSGGPAAGGASRPSPLPSASTSSPGSSVGASARARILDVAADFEPVQLRTQDDLRLAASFFPARTRRDVRAPAAILVHDAGRSRADLVRLATTLQRRGFAVLTLDLRGHGESRTPEIAWTPDDMEAAERLWAFTLRDLDAGAAYLRSRDDVHTSHLSLVGFGAGAAIAARHAVRDANARAVVLVAPSATSLGFNLLADVKDLGGLPTLILAERDRKPDADRLAEAGNRAEGHTYIAVTVLRANGTDVLDDRRLPAEIMRHLQDNVVSAKR